MIASNVAIRASLVLLVAHQAFGFCQQQPSSVRATTERSTQTALGLTADEILAKARKASGVPEEEESPKLFDDDILSDMQSSLLKMERRVKEGPGSLSLLESEELQNELGRIVDEMHRNPHRRIVKPNLSTRTQQPGEPFVDPPSPVAKQSAPIAAAPVPPVAQPTEAAPHIPITVDTTNDEEGPAFDGTGGMGQPRGTVNTYIIEGMDEMTSEEYRLALQESIIARQAKRKSGGTTGNKATWDYLSSLNGATGVLKSDGVERKEGYKPF